MKKKYEGLALSMCIIICLLIIITTFLVHDGFTNTNVYASKENSHTLYAGGSGPNNYTTIQDALDNAGNGDIIFVYNGLYHENLNISKSINLIGENKNHTVIDGENNGDVICINSDFVTISEFTIQHSKNWLCGIKISNSDNTIISACIISNNFGGIRINNANNTIIQNNDINSNIYNGIHFRYSDNSAILNNQISYHNVRGVWIYKCRNSIVEDNNIVDNSEGLSMKKAYYTTVSGNIFMRNGDAIYDYKSSNNIFSNNIFQSNSEESIWFYTISQSTITNNIITSGGQHGIQLDYSNNITIRDNTITHNNWDGIILFHSIDNLILHNSIKNNNRSGIEIYDQTHRNAITENTITHNTNCGIHLWDHSHSTAIDKNTIIGNAQGIQINNCTNNVIWNNRFQNTINALDDGNNTWNSTKTQGENIIRGSYIGGNHWSEYGGQDINNDGLGDTETPHTSQGHIHYGGDWLPLVGTPTSSVDYIAITYYCSQEEIPDISLATNFTLECYAAAFNSTTGFIDFVDAEWALSNTGSDAGINSTWGPSILLFSGEQDGTVQLYAQYGDGHIDTVTFTINHTTYSTIIYQGWTYIGWAHDYITNAETLGQSIPGCTLLGYFEGKTQIFHYHVVGTPWDSFPITQGMAIFIYSTQTDIWQVER